MTNENNVYPLRPELEGAQPQAGGADVIAAAQAEGGGDEKANRIATRAARLEMWRQSPILNPITGVEQPHGIDAIAWGLQECKNLAAQVLGFKRNLLARAMDEAEVGEDGLPTERTRYIRGEDMEVRLEQDLSEFSPSELKRVWGDFSGEEEVRAMVDFLSFLSGAMLGAQQDDEEGMSKLAALDEEALRHQLLSIGQRSSELVLAYRRSGVAFRDELLRADSVKVNRTQWKKALRTKGNEVFEQVKDRISAAVRRPTGSPKFEVGHIARPR